MFRVYRRCFEIKILQFTKNCYNIICVLFTFYVICGIIFIYLYVTLIIYSLWVFHVTFKNIPLNRVMKPKYPHKTTYLPDKLYHIRLYRVHLVPVTIDYIARCKSNYHIWWTGPTLSQLDHSSQFGPALNDALARFVYSRLFKYTQQHTSGFTENNIGPRTSLGL
jgi:hypothetical protein